jgi:hypothetical protein
MMNTKMYDIFKLVVVAVLAIIIVVLIFRLPGAGPDIAVEEPVAVDSQEMPVEDSEEKPAGDEMEEANNSDESQVGDDQTDAEETDPDNDADEAEANDMDLPEFPESGTKLTYNPDDGLLYSADGTPAFRLNSDTNTWEPNVSDDFSAELPEGAALSGNDLDGWQVTSEDGNLLYRWNAETLTWDMVAAETAAEPELPSFPTADFEWVYNSDMGEIQSPNGMAAFSLDAENERWVPVISAEVAANLPANAQPVANEDGTWALPDTDGNSLYNWNSETLTWDLVAEPVAEESPAPTQADCPLALPPRLQVGQTAVVMTNLNLRDTPGIENNLSGSLIYNSQITVIGGPQCEPHQDGAYMWWEVEKVDGSTGWAAEGSIGNPFYFLATVE